MNHHRTHSVIDAAQYTLSMLSFMHPLWASPESLQFIEDLKIYAGLSEEVARYVACSLKDGFLLEPEQSKKYLETVGLRGFYENLEVANIITDQQLQILQLARLHAITALICYFPENQEYQEYGAKYITNSFNATTV